MFSQLRLVIAFGAMLAVASMASMTLLWNVNRLAGELGRERLRIATLEEQQRQLGSDLSLVRGALDLMAADEREIREVHRHERDFVLDSTAPTEDDFSGGWNNFFDFLRRNDRKPDPSDG